MDKNTAKVTAAAPVTRNATAVCKASTLGTTTFAVASSSKTTLGVQKFCSKIRHKIEDNLAPRLTGKLYKSGKHSVSMCSLSLADSTSGRYTSMNKQATLPAPLMLVDSPESVTNGNDGGGVSVSASSTSRRLTGMLKHQRRNTKATKSLSKKQISAPIGKVTTNSGFSIATLALTPTSPDSGVGTYVDSDEEYQLSLNLTKQSLEDEIFEELEKAAHDEGKLNAVLENFDRLLTDFNEVHAPATTDDSDSNVTVVAATATATELELQIEPPTAFADESESCCANRNEATVAVKTEFGIAAATVAVVVLQEAALQSTDGCVVEEAAMQPVEPPTVTTSLLEVVAATQNAVAGVAAVPITALESSAAAAANTTLPPKRLQKSKSTLAIPRRNFYQSPDAPTLQNIRYALATRARSKSVWELTASGGVNSKIPIFKALPLQKRSNSFCSTSCTEVVNSKERLSSTPTTTKTTSVSASATAARRVAEKPISSNSNSSSGSNRRPLIANQTRSASALTLTTKSKNVRSASTSRQQLQLQQQQQQQQTLKTTQTRTQSPSSQQQQQQQLRSKRKSLPTEKLLRSNSRLQLERTKSSIAFNVAGVAERSGPRRTPSSNSLSGASNNSNNNSRALTSTAAVRKLHRSRDELLDKCLEKGHEILRKVESINTEGVRRVVNTTKSTHGASNAKHAGAAAVASAARSKVKTATSTALAGKKITKDTPAKTSSSTSAASSTVNGAVLKRTSRAPPATKRLQYANEEKVTQPQLEFCKIIPPVLGETSDKHAELLVNVVQAKVDTHKQIDKQLKQQPQPPPKQLVGVAANTTSALGALDYCKLKQKHLQAPTAVAQQQQKHATTATTTKTIIAAESDSDDSGHISNENDAAMHTLSTSTTSSVSLCESDMTEDGHADSSANKQNNNNSKVTLAPCKSAKITELLEKFEKQSFAAGSTDVPRSAPVAAATAAPTKLCTSTRIAQLEAIQCIQTHVEFYPTYSKEILFRSGVLSELEAKRDELLSDRIIQFQAYCRGYLARKQVARRRVQELAVRCIQRNVKAFLTVRDWPWWRLLVRVTPLLNVHRTEEQLKTANEELATLRTKLEKIENDRNELKTDNQKLEAKLSEMTVDLAEERSAANIATERLEAETAERLKLDKELTEQQHKVKNLQETSEKLEMELICAKSDLNGISEDEDPENDESGNGVYKLKYERVARELEFTKRRLQTQHEHDLEQLVGLKKQLEKKLADAYEEVEEQRAVVGQWKRKAQKMTNEMNDLRMLLEEQNARNNLLEKKQRKFDAECQSLQDAARQERQAKDRFSREKDVLIAEKFTLEQSLADTRLELELKEEKLASLQRELEEMTFGGSTEEEIAQLRRSKNELDRRVKEQEEELDEMAGQVQLLEQAKLRLEMTLETMRKEARREAQQRDDELEEARGSAYKKIKALECQLETEHEERTLLLREKHELERRLSSMEDQDRVDRQAEEAATQKLKRDLRKYKALLKDAQAQLERLKADTPGKTLIRQLRNQLEDAESARTLAMKARQAAEAELAEVQAMFDESHKARNDAEERANVAHRDRAELQAQIEENEEELAELMKKYSAAVKQLNTEQIAVSEYEFKLSELEAERNNLKEQVSELQQRLDNVENMADPSTAILSKRLELRSKELESRLELEQATRARLEVQVSRLKETLEKVQNEVAQAKGREMQAQDALKKSQKGLRDMREEHHMLTGREQESVTKRKDLEKKLEQVESESSALKNDLRLALQRIADLQQAMEEGDDDVSESDDSQSTDGSISDLEQRLRPIKVKRTATNGDAISPSTTKTLVREKDDNSPRITLTSPSSPHIHKLAAAAKQQKTDADTTTTSTAASASTAATATVESKKTQQPHSITTDGDSLKNGEASYA